MLKIFWGIILGVVMVYISNNDERIQELEERIKILEAIVLNHQAAEMKNI